MSSSHVSDVFVGRWSYRSFHDNPDLSTALDQLALGSGTIEIVDAPPEILRGTIGGATWSLDLNGSRGYGNPMTVRFRGTGKNFGADWIYAYVGYLVPEWPEGIDQKTAMVGSIVRVISHPHNGGTSPAGVVGSWYAVKRV